MVTNFLPRNACLTREEIQVIPLRWMWISGHGGIAETDRIPGLSDQQQQCIYLRRKRLSPKGNPEKAARFFDS